MTKFNFISIDAHADGTAIVTINTDRDLDALCDILDQYENYLYQCGLNGWDHTDEDGVYKFYYDGTLYEYTMDKTYRNAKNMMREFFKLIK